MSEFVKECRREWKRLRVPDAIANEMAADLEADLKEAEAEGASAEEVLGSSAFDPRAFAAAWAAERGVVEPPTRFEQPAARGERAPRRSRALAALAVSGLLALIGALIAIHRSGSSQSIASPFTRRFVLPQPGFPAGAFDIHTHLVSVLPNAIGVLLLLVGIVGLILSTLYWSGWRSSGHWSQRRPESNPTAGGGFN